MAPTLLNTVEACGEFLKFCASGVFCLCFGRNDVCFLFDLDHCLLRKMVSAVVVFCFDGTYIVFQIDLVV